MTAVRVPVLRHLSYYYLPGVRLVEEKEYFEISTVDAMLSPELYYAVVRHHNTFVWDITERKFSNSRLASSVDCTYVGRHVR